mgnify:CR=1 FL=1
MLGSRPNMFANLRTVSWNLRNLTYVLLHEYDSHIIIGGPFLKMKIAKSRTGGMGFVMNYMTVPGLARGLQKFTKCQ